MSHIDDVAWEYTMNALETHERTRVERHLPTCAQCTQAVRTANEELAALAAGVPPMAPDAALKERLLKAAQDPAPFAWLTGALAALADLSKKAMAQQLTKVPEASAWQRGPAGGVDIIHIDHGPACAGAAVGFIRIRRGTRFPKHQHLGPEVILVMNGELHDADGAHDANGAVYTAGQRCHMHSESSHWVQAGPDQDVLFLVVAHGGVRIGHDVIGPGDSRL